ncbi:MAG: IPTL-CTERM sorting domain-containing protein [Deltaproteobacteria bacterium]|nr:IPTL-CTERM sorting domain-containing protein [Deltaproteobacteria bacterium]
MDRTKNSRPRLRRPLNPPPSRLPWRWWTGMVASASSPLIVEGPDAANGILKVWRYIPTLGGWGLIGLAALMAGAGAWMVRRRKRQ